MSEKFGRASAPTTAGDLIAGAVEKILTEKNERIAELEAALAFYADPDGYYMRGLDGRYPPILHFEGGALARKLVPNWEDIEPPVGLVDFIEK